MDNRFINLVQTILKSKKAKRGMYYHEARKGSGRQPRPDAHKNPRRS